MSLRKKGSRRDCGQAAPGVVESNGAEQDQNAATNFLVQVGGHGSEGGPIRWNILGMLGQRAADPTVNGVLQTVKLPDRTGPYRSRFFARLGASQIRTACMWSRPSPVLNTILFEIGNCSASQRPAPLRSVESPFARLPLSWDWDWPCAARACLLRHQIAGGKGRQ